jgi:hypothetical protein
MALVARHPSSTVDPLVRHAVFLYYSTAAHNFSRRSLIKTTDSESFQRGQPQSAHTAIQTLADLQVR